MANTRESSEAKTEVYQEKEDKLLEKFKEFWSHSIDFYMDDFLKNGGEIRAQLLRMRIEFAESEELISYHQFINKLALKYHASKEDKEKSLSSNELIVLGDAYCHGEGVKKSYSIAHECFSQQENSISLFKLGFLFILEKNYKQAKLCFEKSKAQGSATAAFYLGEMYFYGRGVKKDVDRAFSEFMFAYEQNIPQVFFCISHFFSNRKKK